MTLGLCAKFKRLSAGRTTRIPVPLTLLDDCLVRAIVLFLGCPSGRYFDISARGCFRWACSRQRVRSQRSARLSSLSRALLAELLESPGRNRTGPPGSVFWQECRISLTVRVRLASASKTLGPRGESLSAFLREYALAADGTELDS